MTDDAVGDSAGPAAGPPVFVDVTGRRARVAGWLGRGAALLCLLYLVFVAIALVATPGVLPLTLPGLGPVLPGPGAPLIHGTAGRPARPAIVLTPSPTSARTPGAGPTSTGAPPAPGATSVRATPTKKAVPVATPTHTRQGTGSPQASPTPTGASATPTASPTPRRTGKPTSTPSHPTHP